MVFRTAFSSIKQVYVTHCDRLGNSRVIRIEIIQIVIIMLYCLNNHFRTWDSLTDSPTNMGLISMNFKLTNTFITYFEDDFSPTSQACPCITWGRCTHVYFSVPHRYLPSLQPHICLLLFLLLFYLAVFCLPLPLNPHFTACKVPIEDTFMESIQNSGVPNHSHLRKSLPSSISDSLPINNISESKYQLSFWHLTFNNCLVKDLK